MAKSRKNGRVEFLRFLFALSILFFHIHKRFAVNGDVSIGNTGIYFFNHGYIGVEFFFLVSGYLLAAGAYAKRNVPTDLIGTETAQVMWKKIKHIFPYHLFAILLTIAVNSAYLCDTALERYYYVMDSWSSLFFLQVFGFDSTWVNKLTWYLDVWLMVTFVFYFLLRKYYDIFAKIICPILACFVLGYLAKNYVSIAGVDDWTGNFYKCFLRGLAEMALGCSAYSLTRCINKLSFSKRGKVVMALLEFICYLLVFNYACTEMSPKYSFPIIFIMWVGLILTFSDINPAHGIFDKPVFELMGKASLLIYLNQFYVIRLVQETMGESNFWLKALVCTIGTFIGAFICEKIVTWFNIHKVFRKIMYEN